MGRSIALIDMNSFFASCHQAADPGLAGRKVIVAGDPQKRTGIVLAASYPAKAAGIFTGMPLWKARQLCPDGIFFKPRYSLYIEVSSKILRVLKDFTDLVEPFSIDEAFIDLTGIIRLSGTPEEIAVKIKKRIYAEAGVRCSVGIGPNKLIAKMAAGLEKPDGLTILETVADFRRVFWPRPVRQLFGIGPRYERHLKLLNIITIGELAGFPVEILKKRWGKNGELLWHCANGTDHSPVRPGTLERVKSIGHQRTLPRDLRGFEKIKIIILELSEMVARRARRGGYAGRTVFLVLRDQQLSYLARSLSMAAYTDLAGPIYRTACELLQRHWDETRAVRLVGVTLGNLIKWEYRQYDLFGEEARREKLALACDALRDRFGEAVIFRGISLLEGSLYDGQKQE